MRLAKSLKRAAITPSICTVVVFAARAIFEDRLLAWFSSKFDYALANDALRAVWGDVVVFSVIILGLALTWTLARNNKNESRRDRWRGTVMRVAEGLTRLEALMRRETKLVPWAGNYEEVADRRLLAELPGLRAALVSLLQEFGKARDEELKGLSLMTRPLETITYRSATYRSAAGWLGPDLVLLTQFLDRVSDDLAIDTDAAK